MPKKPVSPPARFPVSVVVDGKKYSGSYTVSGRGGMATVTVHASGGTKSTHAGSSAQAIAGALLRELAIDGKAGPGSSVSVETKEADENADDSSSASSPEADKPGG